MIKSKRQSLIVIGAFTLILALVTTTYAFFNYTRTGSNNTIKVGRISFVTRQTKTINLTNLFPIDPTETGIMDDDTKVGTLEIEIEGDTDYVDGVEYLISSANSNIYTNTGQTLPISLDITVNNLGNESSNYFEARESKNATIYKKMVGDTLNGNEMLLVGYIKPNTTHGTKEGVNGSITIKAYLDKNKIGISDTYDGTESDNNGTTNTWANGRTILTTDEWNAIQSAVVSFKVKVEANEGWVIESLEAIMKKNNIGVDSLNGVNFSKTSSQDNTKGIYTLSGTQNDPNPIYYYRGAVEDNNVLFGNKCWKAVRTTDTGGVKLIYNGNYTNIYSKGDKLSQDEYADALTPGNLPSFDSTDNTWNLEIIDNTNPTISFSVPAGDNYSLVMTGTTGSTTGGSFSFYKNTTTLYSNGGGGGTTFNNTTQLGTLSNNDVIKFTYTGSGSVSSPVTFKIKIEQNGTALSKTDYIFLGERFNFDSNNKKWVSVVAPNDRATMRFKVNRPGNYILEYTNPGGGPFYLFRNGKLLTTKTGTNQIKIINSEGNENFYFDYSQYNISSSGTVEFTIYKAVTGELGCDNEGTDALISLNVNGTDKNMFNYSNGSTTHYAGYMYESMGGWTSYNPAPDTYYGADVEYINGQYHLIDAQQGYDNYHKYTCNSNNPETTCQRANYFFYYSGSSKNSALLFYGRNIIEDFEESKKPVNDSDIKTTIDTWYEENMLQYTNQLEDTIYCNDRTMGNGNNNGWIPNGGDLGTYLLFGAYQRSNYATNTSNVKNKPSLTCSDAVDRFTVNNSKGNGALTYPISMITEDEVVLAGGLANQKTDFYLNNRETIWTLSPSKFTLYEVYMFVVRDGYLVENSANAYNEYGIRPVISIKPNQLITSGTGTIDDPYVIK